MASGGGSPLYSEILQYCTMILQRIRITVVDAGFEPGTSATEVWLTTNEPPHLQNVPALIMISTSSNVPAVITTSTKRPSFDYDQHLYKTSQL